MSVRSSFLLRIAYHQSSVTPPLAGPSGRRPPGMWRSPEPSPGSGGRPGLRATHAAWRRWWQPPKVSLGHPGDVHFGLLKLISFIPWLRNGQIWPKGPYPNQTKVVGISFSQMIKHMLSKRHPGMRGHIKRLPQLAGSALRLPAAYLDCRLSGRTPLEAGRTPRLVSIRPTQGPITTSHRERARERLFSIRPGETGRRVLLGTTTTNALMR